MASALAGRAVVVEGAGGEPDRSDAGAKRDAPEAATDALGCTIALTGTPRTSHRQHGQQQGACLHRDRARRALSGRGVARRVGTSCALLHCMSADSACRPTPCRRTLCGMRRGVDGVYAVRRRRVWRTSRSAASACCCVVRNTLCPRHHISYAAHRPRHTTSRTPHTVRDTVRGTRRRFTPGAARRRVGAGSVGRPYASQHCTTRP